jgi:hypothetical protein
VSPSPLGAPSLHASEASAAAGDSDPEQRKPKASPTQPGTLVSTVQSLQYCP